ncbi:MAG: 4-vinyl reductase [Thermoproteota archaeon]
MKGDKSASESGCKAFDLPRMVIDPDKKIYFISFTVTRGETPTPLLTTLSKKHGLKIVGLVRESVTIKEETEVSIFLETPEKMERKKLENLIKKEIENEKIEGVKDIRVFDHMGNFDADVYHFPITIGGSRAVIFSPPILEGLVKGFRESFGTTIVQTILWNQGKEIGKTIVEMYKKDFGLSKARDVLEMLRARALMFGWARMEIVTFNEVKRRAVIRVFDNWECSIFKGSNEPQSHFIRGILAGFFNAIFGEGFYAAEVKCIAKGDSYCEFILEKLGTETG